MTIALHLARTIAALEVRRDPHWGAPLATGKYVGYRKLDGLRGTWIARMRGADGKQKFNSLGSAVPGFGYDEAKAAALVWFKKESAPARSSAGLTVEKACRDYVADRLANSGGATARDIDMRFRRTVYGGSRYEADNPRNAERHNTAAHPIARMDVEDLTLKILKDWRSSMSASHIQGGKPLAPRTINRNVTAFKAALNLAAVDHRLPADLQMEWADVPMLDGGGTSNQREIYLDLEQRRAFLANISHAQFRDLAEAGMLTGARVGELALLTAGNFDARTGTLKILRGVRSTAKKRERVVVLNTRAVSFFARCAAGKKSTDILLPDANGARWHHSSYDHLVKIAAAGAGLPAETVFYTLRHSYITQALVDDMPALEVAKMTGTSLKMIDEHYGHLIESQAKSRIERVNLL